MIENGDKIGIISLAGDCSKTKVEKACEYFKKLGCKIELSKNIYDKQMYLAGSDEDKISELHRFYLDSDIKLILNARGGYGTLRLINNIDYNIINSNPKPFCGFSDITALLLIIYKKTGQITYHSPMACSDFAEGVNDFTLTNFKKAINNEELRFEGDKIYRSGNANGIIWGGNLATVTSLCGIDFIPDNDFIFFAEDLNEPVYKIDRMFTQLFNIEKFKNNCKGIVLGDFIGIDNQSWLDDFFESLSVPTTGGFKITHNNEKITIPIGKNAILSDTTLVIK